MRGWGALVTLLACAACNQVYDIETTELVDSPDLDGDLLEDDQDDCIAAAVDAASDLDRDGIPAADDPCPASDEQTSLGTDGLGACDPFPTLAGDRHVCSMFFGSVELNSQLWQPRENERGFAFGDGFLIGLHDNVLPTTSVLAVERVMPRDGTVSMIMSWGAPDFAPKYTFRVYVSANATTPSPSDVACEFENSETNMTARIVGGTQSASNADLPASGGDHTARVQFQPGKAGINLTCVVSYDRAGDGARVAVPAGGHFDGLGEQGFGVTEGAAVVNGLLVYHTDAQPDLLMP